MDYWLTGYKTLVDCCSGHCLRESGVVLSLDWHRGVMTVSAVEEIALSVSKERYALIQFGPVGTSNCLHRELNPDFIKQALTSRA